MMIENVQHKSDISGYSFDKYKQYKMRIILLVINLQKDENVRIQLIN